MYDNIILLFYLHILHAVGTVKLNQVKCARKVTSNNVTILAYREDQSVRKIRAGHKL